MLHEVIECIKHFTREAHGYVQNTFSVLQEESKEEDDDMQTVITQMAALTTQSQRTATTMAETSTSVAAAINQLHANQQAMQQQFAAFTTQCNMAYQPAPAMQPPIMQFSIPNLATFNTAGRGGGRRGGHGRGGRANFVNTGGRNAQTPFTNKAACPPLVEVADAVVVRYLLNNKLCHAIQHQCIQI